MIEIKAFVDHIVLYLYQHFRVRKLQVYWPLFYITTKTFFKKINFITSWWLHIKFNYKMLLTCEMKNENDECQMDNERTFLSLWMNSLSQRAQNNTDFQSLMTMAIICNERKENFVIAWVLHILLFNITLKFFFKKVLLNLIYKDSKFTT